MACVFLALLFCAPTFSQGISDRFDASFQRHSERHLPWDWRWLKAQCYQESRLDPRARSPVGAMGLCQFMPGTWREMSRAMGWHGVSPWSARPNIQAAAAYDARLRRIWAGRQRPEWRRRQLTMASYNAGAGNIIAAQSRCNDARDWQCVRECLPEVTGRHAAETIGYVRRIKQWFEQL